jgi:uncharacterized protein involved in oxidation of intracellular sulfur
METLTMILDSVPYGNEKLWNALRLAKALISAAVDMKVNIFLIGDAVVAAKKGQKTPEGYYNLEVMLKDLVQHGVEVMACTTCANARGINKEDLIEGVKLGTVIGLAEWIENSHKILSF